MKTISKALIVLTLLSLCGCYKIYFHRQNIEQYPSDAGFSTWHHIFVFGLVEGSEPVTIANYCGPREWNYVETENSFLTGLVGAIVPYAIYTPRAATVACNFR